MVALNGALLVNAAILVMAAAVFFKRGIVVTEIQQAHVLLAPLLGTSMAGVMFAVALLCSGQSSTLTGTMAGQIVMEGFLNFRMRPWLRRLITRSLAVVPAALTIYYRRRRGSTLGLLLLSQAILSMQLPFAIVPLIHFTSDRARMGPFANRALGPDLAWLTAADRHRPEHAAGEAERSGDWLESPGRWRPLVLAMTVPLGIGLLRCSAVDHSRAVARAQPRFGRAPVVLPDTAGIGRRAPVYHRILLPLDHTALDRLAVSHGAAMAKLYGATLFLLHVEEGVTSQIYGQEASTAEVEAGEQYLDRIAQIAAGARNRRWKPPSATRPRPSGRSCATPGRCQPDLVIMGAHGHGGLKDLVFGNTINPVRHDLEVPMLIVRPGKS